MKTKRAHTPANKHRNGRAKKTTRTAKGKKPAQSKGRRKKALGEVPAAPVRSPYPLPRKTGSSAIIMTTLAVGAAGVLGYFGWQYFHKKKVSQSANLDETLLQQATGSNNSSGSSVATSYPVIPTTDTPASSNTSSGAQSSSSGSGSSWSSNAGSEFPLKKGSKGNKVKALQQAIIDKYGKSYLPKYGADGDFGTETANALKKLNLPASVDETTYNVLIQGSSGSSAGSSSTATLGKDLYQAAQARNFSKVLSLLKSVGSKDQYKTVSAQFQLYRIDGGVRKTLVNGLLSVFTNESQKQQIRFEFIRMGLKYDGTKWSLDGFGGRNIVTTEPTTVWVDGDRSTQVPAAMVLGEEIARKLDYTLFRNNSRFFLVQTKSIQYF